MTPKDKAVFIVTANSSAELNHLMEHHPDGVILAWPDLSIRQKVFLTDLQQWRQTVQKLKEQGIQVYVNAMKMMMERDQQTARDMLKNLKDLHVDGIYTADEGYVWLARESGLEHLLIYQPETLIVNGMDAAFYHNLGFQAVSLAHELSIEQTEQIAAQSDGLEVLVQGPYSWMYSRRELLSNYLNEIHHSPLDPCKSYSLIESSRSDEMPVEETAAGTVVYASQPVNSLSVLHRLYDAGIRRFRIDTLFEAADSGAAQLDLYRRVLASMHPDCVISQAKQSGLYTGSDETWYTTTSLRKEKDQPGRRGNE